MALALLDEFGRAIERRDAASVRADSWINCATGLGTWQDKTQYSSFAPVRRLFDSELTNLFSGSAMCAKVVEKRVKEMYRRGYEIESATPKGERGGKPAVKASEADELREYANETFRVDEQFENAQKYSNLY